MSHVTYRTCPLCEATCGLAIHHDNTTVSTIRGDKDDVFSGGFLCPKGALLHHADADPDRLTGPRVRRGDAWNEVSWEEAFEEIDRRLSPILKEHGRDAVGIYLGNPNVHTLSGQLYNRPLIKALGTKNIFSASTVDQMPKHVSSGLMFGAGSLIPVPDLDRTDHLLILGANPIVSNGSLCTAPDFPGRLRALKARGGRLVVVDPRHTETAARADEHIPIRPGTDALLLFAIAHTLLDEDLTDTDALDLSGLDTVRTLAKDFAPERVSGACGIDADVIRRMARELAAAPRAVVYGRLGTCASRFGATTSWLVDVVNALTGNLDRPGGAMFPNPAHGQHRPGRPPGGRGFRRGRWSSRVSGFPEHAGELPAALMAEEIETPGDGQIRAMITVAGNPVLSTPNGPRLARALDSLDLMISVDPYLNETTRHADILLPPPPPLQRTHYDLAFYALAVRNIARHSPAVFELTPGAMREHDILLKLTAIASGFGHETPPAMADAFILRQVIEREVADPHSPLHGKETDALAGELPSEHGPERLLDFLLRAGPYGDHFGAREGLTLAKVQATPHGIDLGALEPRLPEMLRTPSGTVELAPEAFVEDTARLARALDDEADAFVLIGRRHLRSNNSWMHNIDKLSRGTNQCTLKIHPQDADRLGLGERARVFNEVGALEVDLERTEEMMPGVVSLPHGWGHDMEGTKQGVARARPGVNVNTLVAGDLDPLSGNAVLNGVPVTLAPLT